MLSKKFLYIIIMLVILLAVFILIAVFDIWSDFIINFWSTVKYISGNYTAISAVTYGVIPLIWNLGLSLTVCYVSRRYYFLTIIILLILSFIFIYANGAFTEREELGELMTIGQQLCVAATIVGLFLPFIVMLIAGQFNSDE